MKKPVTAARRAAKRTRRVFSAEFQREAARRMAERRAQGARIQQIGRELDVVADFRRTANFPHP
jgi:transposase-like protein